MSARLPEVIVRENGLGPYQQDVRIGRHQLVADEPVTIGGGDAGPAPYDLLMAALGACTSMTLRMYAERRSLALRQVTVEVCHEKISVEGQAAKVDRFARRILLDGDLTDEQRHKLLEIANKCPVHRTLSSSALIETELCENPQGATAA